MVTFEEFEKRVRKSFDEDLLAFTQERKDGYFNGEEAQSYIRRQYEGYQKYLKEGKITEDIFIGGVASTVGGCLALMCD